MWGGKAPAARPRRRDRRRWPGGRGETARRPLSPLCPFRAARPVFPAWGCYRVPFPPPPPPPSACLVLGLRPPAPRLPRGGRVEGLGGRARARPRLRPRRRSPPVAVPLCPRRVSGRAAWRRGPRGASGVGSRPSPGRLRASARAGRPPSAAYRRRPWTVLTRSVGRPLRPCLSPAPRLSPPSPLPQASGPGPGSSSSSLPLLPTPITAPCPLAPRFPPQPPALWLGGPGSRVRGGTGWVRWGLGRGVGSAKGARSGPPGGPGGGKGRGGGGMAFGGRRGPVVAPGGAGGGGRTTSSSVTGRQRRCSCALRGWPRPGSASRRGGGLRPRCPPLLGRPPPPVQVPSASRRGGLKTPWGSPVRLGSGRSGPWGGGSLLPQTPPPTPLPPGPGLPCHATVSAWPSGGGYPAARRAVPWGVLSPRPRCVCVGGGRWEPPGRLWGCPSSPPRLCGAGGRMPRCPTFPTFSEFGLVGVRLGRQEAPLRGECAVPGGGFGPPLTIKTRTTLSGGSLGSCVDEERS